jgi:hypothetical protein
MAWNNDDQPKTARDVQRLLRIQDRALQQLEAVRADLDADGTTELLRALRNSTGSAIPDRVREVVAAVEEAVRALKVSDSHTRAEFTSQVESYSVDGLPNLPVPLARFLAERVDQAGFTYELAQDPIRGWIIHWKERAADGTVRGSGQFYERPYAWLDE